ncbi:MAG: c-type cytochrome [Pirellulales bacterium]|nr:c-type cytochrome [Pirellulales bacterium]
MIPVLPGQHYARFRRLVPPAPPAAGMPLRRMRDSGTSLLGFKLKDFMILSVRIVVASAWLLSICVALPRHAPADEPPLPDTQAEKPALTTPADAQARVRPPEGFSISLFAAEPDVRQPIAFTFDTRGRMWVAENYTYAEAPRTLAEDLRDRIVCLEDTDRDGRADRRLVFWDQGRELTSVEVGFGGVWAMCPPRLLFLPDRDRDDRPDGEPTVMLDGFDLVPANHHNFANGLKWGPDGWLYGRNGITHVGRVGTPTTRPDQRVVVGPGIWRFHPITHQFEMVAHGTTNPWGHDWDEHGELFFINTVIGHLWHAVPGSHFRRMFGADPNPYVYQLMEQTADHFHWDTRERWQDIRQGTSPTTAQAGGGHAHSGLMIYQGDNWPSDYRGQVFAINLHGRRLNRDWLERSGAGFVAHHGQDCFFFDDPWFRGIDLASGPDGSVFVIDWSDVGECHETDGVHRNSGRIFRLAWGKPDVNKFGDLAEADNAMLLGHLAHENVWFSRQVRHVLQQRAAAGSDLADTNTALREFYESQTNVVPKLRALWCLHATGGWDESWLLAQLAQPNEHLRAWAVRLLADQPISSPALPALVELAGRESSGLVLLYLASALGHVEPEERVPLATAILAHEEFADDPRLPLLVWYGIEPYVARQPSAAVHLATGAKMPLVRQFIARRITQRHAEQPAGLDALVQALVAAEDRSVARDLLTGIAEALRGVHHVDAPQTWSAAYEKLIASADSAVRQSAREVAAVFGDGVALEQLLQIAASNQADTATRRAAIESLARARHQDCVPVLRALLTDLDLGADAARGLAAFDDPANAGAIIEQFGRMVPPARVAALETLVSRPAFAAALLDGVQREVIKPGELSVFQVRQLQAIDDETIRRRVAELWPELRPIAADKQARIAELATHFDRAALRSADLKAGKVVWEKSCAKCHTLFGEGGRIGPDLTGSQRGNLDYLLENIVDPSATLAPSFRMSTIALTDGRVINGVVLTKTADTWEVQTESKRELIAVPDIDESAETNRSLMPDGLLDVLTADERRDLFGYLMAAEPPR